MPKGTLLSSYLSGDPDIKELLKLVRSLEKKVILLSIMVTELSAELKKSRSPMPPPFHPYPFVRNKMEPQ